MDLIKTIILGIVEGLTEFLPVSSTGHLKLAEQWMGKLLNNEFANTFDIFIQIGAIAAVVVYFRHRIMSLLRGQPSQSATLLEAAGAGGATTAVAESTRSTTSLRAVWLIVLATLPLAPAYVLAKKSDHYLEAHPSAEVIWIASALTIGGIIMAIIEFLRPRVTTKCIEAMSWKQALSIGCCQVLAAVFPGTSRSAATIMPGLMGGLSREAAAEFSFFLAIPAMTGACGLKLVHFIHHSHASANEWMLLMIGTLVSFLVAWIVIAGFMAFIRRHNFLPFAIYRIILGVVVLIALR